MKHSIFIFFAIATIVVSCAPKVIVPAKQTVSESVSEVVTAIDLAEGKNLLETRCVECHKIFDAQSFDHKEWKQITLRMQKKAMLNDVEINKVYHYIVSNL
jgi:cytochrome c5